MGYKNFEPITDIRYWVQKVLPLVYDDSLSYYELLNKVVLKLNEVIENNNKVPEFIVEQIKNYITSGAIDSALKDILANFILNVKYPPEGLKPAVGDGSEDDTEAVQGCIDYANEKGYGVVYFPYGKYLINSLHVKSNVSIRGFDRYSTVLVLKAGATKPLMYGENVRAVGIYSMSLDGNSGVQVNDLDLINISGYDCELADLILDDMYRGLVFNGNNGHLDVHSCIFGRAVENSLVINGTSVTQLSQCEFHFLSSISGDCVAILNTVNGRYDFTSTATCNLCVRVGGSNNYIDCTVVNATKVFEDNGVNNTIVNRNESANVHFSGTVSDTIGGYKGKIGNNYEMEVSGNYNLKVLRNYVLQVLKDSIAVFTGSTSVTHKGAYTESNEDDKTVNVNGISEFTVDGTATENYNGQHNTVTGGNESLDVTGTLGVHVDDATSVNLGGNLTEVVNGNVNKGVKGVYSKTIENLANFTCNGLVTTVNGVKRDEVAIATTHASDTVKFYTTNPLQYNYSPKVFEESDFFKYIKFADANNGEHYKILVANEKTSKLTAGDFAKPEDYGAVGNGSADDSTALQNCLNSGKNVMLTRGKIYKITDVQIPSNTVIYGYGASVKIGTANRACFVNKSNGQGGYSGNSSIHIYGVTFDGDNKTCTAIAFGHMIDANVVDCVFKNVANYHCVEMNAVKGGRIINCMVRNYGSPNGQCSEAIQIDTMASADVFPWFGPYDSTGCADIEVANCKFIGVSTYRYDVAGATIVGAPSAVGNHTQGKSTEIRIHDNYFENWSVGCAFTRLDNSLIQNNVFKDCYGGVYIRTVGSYVNITGNYFFLTKVDSDPLGIACAIHYVGSVSGTSITQGTFMNNIIESANNGIVAAGESIFIKDNKIRGCSVYGIEVRDGTYYCDVDGNTVISSTSNDYVIHMGKGSRTGSIGNIKVFGNSGDKFVVYATETVTVPCVVANNVVRTALYVEGTNVTKVNNIVNGVVQ